MEGRLLLVEKKNPYENIALEEAMLRHGNKFTFRLWSNQLSIIIGRAQLAKIETDLDYCKKIGIPIVRRISGGGAVYNGPGNLNWSFIIPSWYRSEHIFYTRDAKELVKNVGGFMAACFSSLGCSSWLVDSSIYSSIGKISGISAYITKEAALCHGTLLVDADLEIVERLTRPKEVYANRKYRRSSFAKVANSFIRFEDISRKIREVLMLREEREECIEEMEECKRLTETKYIKESWNLGDPFEF